MNRRMMIYLLIAIGVIGLLAWNMRFSDGIETRPYDVVKKFDGFEVRAYTPATYAGVIKEGRMMETGNSGFRDLAGYIFGGNDRQEKIAMTAPVTFRPSGDSTEMLFMMPKGFTPENLPVPDNKKIRMWTAPAIHMAVLRFSGFASNRDIERKGEELLGLMQQNGMKPEGDLIFMAYNPPFQVLNRRNEVAYEVSWK